MVYGLYSINFVNLFHSHSSLPIIIQENQLYLPSIHYKISEMSGL